MQKVTFYNAKGRLLACKRRPFGKRFVSHCMSTDYGFVNRYTQSVPVKDYSRALDEGRKAARRGQSVRRAGMYAAVAGHEPERVGRLEGKLEVVG